MSLTCWNCNHEIDTSGLNCPHCNALIDEAVISQMSSFHIRNTPASPISSGVVVADRYDIKREIGRGGMGIVFLAHDKYMEREVALKIIPQELSMDPKAISDLKRETSLALELTHEYIVRLYNLDTWKNLTFVTMEYVPGGTLSHLMVKNGGRLSLDEALPLLRQVAEALDYTHRKSPPVMHLDIKPLNILISKDGYAKIADYGLARVLRDLATRISAWEAAGTLAYMAPEQIRGKGIGPWSDIYALAAVAYELLSGHPPFHTGDLRWQIMHEEVEPIEFISEKVNNALLYGLQKKPDHRPSSAGELVAVLAGEKPVPKIEELRSIPEKGGTVAAEFKTPDSRPEAEVPGGRLRIGGLKAGLSAAAAVFIIGLLGWVYGDRLMALMGTLMKAPRVQEAISEQQETAKPFAAEQQLPVPTPVEEVTPPPEAPPEPVKADAAVIAVQSEPAGADVYLNGDIKGRTPLVLEGMKAGEYALSIKKEGFEPRNEKVVCQADERKEISLVLQTLYGAIDITSQPADAVIQIDGKEIGRSPRVITDIEAGKKKIVLTAEGFEPWSRVIQVAKGQEVKLKAELIPSMGDLRIVSEPSRAEVFLSGIRKGVTPLTLKQLKAGPVMLEVRKECYQPAIKEVTVIGRRLTETRMELSSDCGRLSVNSQPAGAKWYLDGKYRGITPMEVADVDLGEHTVKLTLDNHREKTMTVQVKPTGSEKLLATLETDLPAASAASSNPAAEMEFVLAPKGCFQMGSAASDPERNMDEGPQHEVCLDGFWIGKHEVTQGQWEKVMNQNPSTLKNGKEYPVVNVSWNDIQLFIKKLNEANRGKWAFRLPTEAEWEYACRSGGKPERYAGGNTADGVAWHEGNSRRSFQPVGRKAANGIGIFDMSGNVYEWVEDIYAVDAYNRHGKNNPVFREAGKYRVCRGGSWLMRASECRSTNRSYYFPDSRNYNLGFRLVRVPQG
ncbi:MAG: PEGA domain-containing protein [Thermodesulfobacteriota bacterium]